jgi:dihydroflavonol-4-reductase
MTALVTGGTGFVGGAIVRALLAEGEDVRVLARTTSRTDDLAALGVEIVYGDILNQASIEAALRGCDTLFHAAAPFDFWAPDKRVFQTTTAGTRNALEAAGAVGVDRIVYTSAASTIGERRGEVGTETTPHRGYHLTPYERAECAAEAVAQSYVDRGLPIIIVNPASVYGPGNFKPVGRGTINLVNGRTPAKFRGWVSYVYIEDAGRGHVLAARRGRSGERYILSERVVSMEDWFAIVCGLAGMRVPPTIPYVFARLYAEIGELIARFTKRPPLLPRDLLRICAHGFRVDGGKAARDLGMTYLPLEEGLRRSLVWYWEGGYLRRRPACAAEPVGSAA